ncbi:uncharacterized protein TrAtP1_009084 [Trichoderma atroviride]|uniref:uncharacterized protein n=1 Tax=Hypocrea atroviridis TaxID=63577 RepID=UPI003316BC68|nr:hypothetical protein TrAtP1_009084 [Trichoderma atroviride]
MESVELLTAPIYSAYWKHSMQKLGQKLVEKRLQDEQGKGLVSNTTNPSALHYSRADISNYLKLDPNSDCYRW